MANPQTPREVVAAFLDAMTVKDYDAGMKFIAPDCDYDNGPLGKVVGPQGTRSLLEPFFAPVIKNEFIIKREITQGPVVVLERLDRHQLADRWVELPVTGVFEVHGGLITVWHDYFDVATITNQWPTA
ncbi:MAG: limonene-1,2-epoxide hydrolase family protein [Parvibaculaceae bacterium]